jgi:signal transduction histidine kinase
MCIKVNQDEALRLKNRPRVDTADSGACTKWKVMVERARATAGATAAIISPAPGRAVVVCGTLPDAAQGLAQAIAAIVWLGDASKAHGAELRRGWGTQACPDIVALQRRFGLHDLALMYWFNGSAPTWIALVNAAREDVPADCAQLRAIAELLREQCMLHAQMREATLVTQRLEDVARASGDWSWETDQQHRYTWVHGILPDASEYAIRPPTVGELMPSGLVVNWLGEPVMPPQDFHAVLRQGEPIVRLVTRDNVHGQSRYVSRSAVPLLHADGSLRGYRGSARDVTQSLEAKAQLWRRDKALRLAKEQAEASSKAKSVLVSKVGHELRTPLNAIVGLAQLIQARSAPGDKASVERWIDQIAKTGWHMVDVLDMLMELGRAGAVNASLTSKPVDVVAVVRDAMHMVERDAHARSISIVFDGHAMVPAVGDRRAICQVVVNLLSNAIKYNREGGWIRLSVKPGPHTQIEIEDTGPGLTEEQIGRLYQPFERLGAGQSDVKGHGLGLLICKELVASMGGTIQVQSAVGQGTTFTVLLPASDACQGHARGGLPPKTDAPGAGFSA